MSDNTIDPFEEASSLDAVTEQRACSAALGMDIESTDMDPAHITISVSVNEDGEVEVDAKAEKQEELARTVETIETKQRSSSPLSSPSSRSSPSSPSPPSSAADHAPEAAMVPISTDADADTNGPVDAQPLARSPSSSIASQHTHTHTHTDSGLEVKQPPGHRRARQAKREDPQTLQKHFANKKLLSDIASGVMKLKKSAMQVSLQIREQLPLTKLRLLSAISRTDRKSLLHPVNPHEHVEDENERAEAIESHWHIWHALVVRWYHSLGMRRIDVGDCATRLELCRKLASVSCVEGFMDEAGPTLDEAAGLFEVGLADILAAEQGNEPPVEEENEKGLTEASKHLSVFVFERWLSNSFSNELLTGEAPTPEFVNRLAKRLHTTL